MDNLCGELEAAAGAVLAAADPFDEPEEESDEDLVALDEESDEVELDDSLLEDEDSLLELDPLLALFAVSRLSVR